MQKNTKTIEFKTEVNQLLDLMIHSLYSHKEIFLRELISNAADAIDKLQFMGLTNADLLKNTGGDFKIKITSNADAKTLIIEDNGIGMNYDDLIEHLGTIAKSGSKAFLENLKKSKEADNPELIGQFGVGFYAAFMVADKIIVKTRKAGEKQAWQWESVGKGSFEITEIEKDQTGTSIELHIKDETKEYLEEFRIKSIVKKYSDFIPHPVVMDIEKEVGEGDKKEKKIEETTLNTQKALWVRQKSEVKAEQYDDFYKQLTHDFQNPWLTYHQHAEGVLEYKMLLFIPQKAPFDLFQQNTEYGVNLYIKRVFIMHNCDKLVPRYLRFVKGVVDSSDLPLNVSREILQDNPLLQKIQKNLVHKILSELAKIKKDDYKKYVEFYKEFGAVLKEGVHFDFENKDKITELLLFESSNTKVGEYVSLEDYVKRMQKDQKNIYYITGISREMVEQSPHMEAFRKKNIEVLFLMDPIDEWIVENIKEYDKKLLQSVTKGDSLLEKSEEEKKESTQKEKEYSSLLTVIKETLKDEIKEVKMSNRLVDSPVCLVAEAQGMSSQMEKMMKSMGHDVPVQKKIMEVNLTHPVFQKMQKMYEQDAKNPELKDYANLLLDQAKLAEGTAPKDMKFFLKKMAEMMAK